jgi:hypothetical protein
LRWRVASAWRARFLAWAELAMVRYLVCKKSG